jgi:hypothetical protein
MEQPNTPRSGMPQPNQPMMTPGPLPPPSPPAPAPQGQSFQLPRTSTPSSRIAFIHGWIFGPVLAVILIVLGLLVPHIIVARSISSPLLGLNVALRVLPLPIQCICYFLAGVFASRRTGTISTGMLTSVWINLWYLLSAIPLYFLQQRFVARAFGASSSGYAIQFVLFTAVFLLIALGLGAGLGALDGLVGKALSKPKYPTLPLQPMQGYGVPELGPH